MRLHEITRGLTEALSFRTDSRGAHHGQSDLTLYAFEDGEHVGHIDYVVYAGAVHVQMIDVAEDKRRRGYGTAMVHELQAMYPDTEINMGGLTDDGSKLLASIPQQVTHNPQYQSTARRLERVKAKLAHYQTIADAFHDNPNPTEEAREKLVALTNRWSALHSLEWRLEQELDELAPSKRLFVR